MNQETENPVRKHEARKELGWGHTKFAAVCRALGLRGRHVCVSKLRQFVDENPGFVTNAVYGRRAPVLTFKRIGRRVRVSFLHQPEIFEEGREVTAALMAIAPRVEEAMK